MLIVTIRTERNASKCSTLLPSTHMPKFIDFLDNVDATGGSDLLEDVLGALDKTLSLNWSQESGVKQIFHIGDAHRRTIHRAWGARVPQIF